MMISLGKVKKTVASTENGLRLENPKNWKVQLMMTSILILNTDGTADMPVPLVIVRRPWLVYCFCDGGTACCLASKASPLSEKKRIDTAPKNG